VSELRILRTAEDVTPKVLEHADEVYLGWFGEGPIDWESFIDRLSVYGSMADPEYDIEEYDNPAIRKIQRHVRALRQVEP
jgi:hypothetical protein